MPIGTRGFVRRITSAGKKELVKTAMALGAIGAERALRGGGTKKSQTITAGKKRKRSGAPVAKHGKKVRTKGKKCKVIDAKPKVSRKFRSKVDRVLTYNKPWGDYSGYFDMQLRQQNTNLYSQTEVDTNGYAIMIDSPLQVLKYSQVLWNNNIDTANPFHIPSTAGLDQKVFVNKSSINFFFKSVSSHVLNIEVYECTAKRLTNDAIQFLINQSYSNIKTTLYDPGHTSGVDVSTADQLGTSPKDWTRLYVDFDVKIHRMKLLPGDYASLSFNGSNNRMFDMSKCELSNAIAAACKGSKRFYFRIINDITVSQNATAGKVFAFPSNQQGGCAIRWSLNYRIRCPEGIQTLQETNNHMVYGHWFTSSQDGHTDQQVVYQNPITSSTNGA